MKPPFLFPPERRENSKEDCFRGKCSEEAFAMTRVVAVIPTASSWDKQGKESSTFNKVDCFNGRCSEEAFAMTPLPFAPPPFPTSEPKSHFHFYASSMGRFLKPDNIIPDLTNPQNWNAYTYVKGNPVNFNDPWGHAGQGMAKPYYFVNGGSASWLNLGAYIGLHSNLFGGNVAWAPSGHGGSGGYETKRVQTGWTFEFYSTEYESTLVAVPVYGAVTLPVGGTSPGWFGAAYGRTIGLANRIVSAVPFSWLMLTGNCYSGKYGTIIVENKWYTDIFGANAVTYGNLIIVDPSFLSQRTEEDIRTLLQEEYAHSTQYGLYGPSFYILYVADWLAFGYENQIFENQAQRTSASMPW